MGELALIGVAIMVLGGLIYLSACLGANKVETEVKAIIDEKHNRWRRHQWP